MEWISRPALACRLTRPLDAPSSEGGPEDRPARSGPGNKTQNGADVGSVLMSLIKTAIEAEVNPVEYLVTLLEQARQVRKEPQLWLPWNYTGQRAA